MTTMIRRGVVLCLALALAGCGDDDDDGFSPTVDDVAGSYTASAFTLTSGNGEFDLLALGATVTATLDADGTTSGRLQVPGGVGGAPAVDEDLAGTWSLSGTTVTFSPSASSLLTDVDFAVGPNTLTGEGIYQGAVLLLVLTKGE
jgi:hypothetical protein